MHQTIKEIIKSSLTDNEKKDILNVLKKDIDIAEKILSGELRYCPDCDDYYLIASFLMRSERKEGKICVYEDYINSGGNEYADGYIDTTFWLCPKGHKKIIDTTETVKR